MKRVVAIHDMSGYGKCSLTVALPVVSACGLEVCPLPTALLSTNTHFDGFTLFDFTPQMSAYIDHWEQISLKVDAIYSGFLGSGEQINYIKMFVEKFRPDKVIIDPVMGDNGVIYKTYTPEMCERMRSLVGVADITTPNLTEAAALIEESYNDLDTSCDGIQEIVRKIQGIGAKNVVVTGVERGNKLYNCCMEAGGEYFEYEVDLLPHMHGTGDLFASVLTGGIMTGHTLREAVESAAGFVYKVMKFTRGVVDAKERGACFEPFLYELRGGIFVGE